MADNQELKSYTQGKVALLCLSLMCIIAGNGYFIYGRYQTYQRLDDYVQAQKKDYPYANAMLKCFKLHSIFMPLPLKDCTSALSDGQPELIRYKIESSYQAALDEQ
jgi:hypothetical protein